MDTTRAGVVALPCTPAINVDFAWPPLTAKDFWLMWPFLVIEYEISNALCLQPDDLTKVSIFSHCYSRKENCVLTIIFFRKRCKQLWL
jgi:hypothetical protein